MMRLDSKMSKAITNAVFYFVLISALVLLGTIIYHITIGEQPIEKWLDQIALVFSSISVSLALVTLLFARVNFQEEPEETSKQPKQSPREVRLPKCQLELMKEQVGFSKEQLELLQKQYGLAEQQFSLLQKLYDRAPRQDESSKK